MGPPPGSSSITAESSGIIENWDHVHLQLAGEMPDSTLITPARDESRFEDQSETVASNL